MAVMCAGSNHLHQQSVAHPLAPLSIDAAVQVSDTRMLNRNSAVDSKSNIVTAFKPVSNMYFSMSSLTLYQHQADLFRYRREALAPVLLLPIYLHHAMDMCIFT
jgi:hypothetical protein